MRSTPSAVPQDLVLQYWYNLCEQVHVTAVTIGALASWPHTTALVEQPNFYDWKNRHFQGTTWEKVDTANLTGLRLAPAPWLEQLRRLAFQRHRVE